MPDHATNAPNTEYFLLGDGRIAVALQWSRDPSLSPIGLLLWDPERMTRKEGTWLFHPELGLQRTMLTVVANGVRHRPTHHTVSVEWQMRQQPEIVARWQAGALSITERFYLQKSSSNLIREVSITPPEGLAAAVQIEAALYANPLLFDEFGTVDGGRLRASGHAAITLGSVPSGRPFERFLTLPCKPDDSGICATFIYQLEGIGMAEREGCSEVDPEREEADAADELPGGSSLAEQLKRQYAIACNGLRAAVSRTGKFDASIWQYGYEWGMDAAMVATAAAISGQRGLARQVLRNILSRLSNDDGMIAESSRFRGGELSELNGNGAVLDAIWHYWQWTGDSQFLGPWWPRIRAIANYLLRQEYQHESGMLLGRRDLWERLPWMGVQPGFDVSHQVFCSVGLIHIAQLAQHLGHHDDAECWREAGARIREAMVNHPRYRLIHEGRLIHRRLADGTPAETMTADPAWFHPDYAPYLPSPNPTEPTPRRCTPDAVEALPIIYGLIPATSEVARRTLEALGLLWGSDGSGGYSRSTPDSDPDSPGPWAFATAFIASAEIEAGATEGAERSLRWLLKKAGAGGAWLEYYGPRATPPFPPVGIIVWGWAQFIILWVRHLLGARIDGDRLVISPKISGIQQTLHVGAGKIAITVGGHNSAMLDGQPIPVENGQVIIPLPLKAAQRLEFM